jgi:hypothetical protein
MALMDLPQSHFDAHVQLQIANDVADRSYSLNHALQNPCMIFTSHHT